MKKLGKKLFVLPVVLLVVAGGAYKFLLAPGEAHAEPPKIAGHVVQLPDEFVLNLAGGHYAKLSVAVVVHGPAGGGGHGGAEGSGLAQEPVIRAIVTDVVTGLPKDDLIDRDKRHHLLEKLGKVLKQKTDEPIDEVMFTDIAVQ